MSTKNIKDLLKKSEGQNLEYLEKLPNANLLIKLLIGFSNAEGGVILVGVSKDRNITGVKEISEKIMEYTSELAANKCVPPVNIKPKITELYGKKILIIEIPRGYSPPYMVRSTGAIYIRSGKTTRIASNFEITRMFQEKSTIEYEKLPLEDAKLSDFDEQTLNQFIHMVDKNINKKNRKNILQNFGFITKKNGKSVPTIGGILILGKDPEKFIVNSNIDIVRFQGISKNVIIEHKLITGNLPKITDIVLEFIKKILRIKIKIIQFKREEIFEYPLEVIRELLVNALIHRDYSITQNRIQCYFFDDRMEITSPGGLVRSVKLENILSERFARNPNISRAMRILGYCEELGTGLIRVKYLLNEYNLPEPKFEEEPNLFRVTIFNTSITDKFKNIIKNKEKQLNQRQKSIIKYIIENGSIKTKECQKILNVSRMTTIRDLSILLNYGFLERRGQGRGTYYVLSGSSK